MIISPPFLPALTAEALNANDPSGIDPMMDAVDGFELPHHGVYPIAFDRRWHCGVHLTPRFQNEPVRAIADGEVVAYRVCQKAIADGRKDQNGAEALNSNTGFVLLKHTTETGDGRTITFHSLYMHLLDLDGIRRLQPQPNNPPEVGTSTALPKWLLKPTNGVQVPVKQKVYRKDMLGYPGACHGYLHLHFEIFMTESDFTAWFSQPGHAVQLDNKAPTTPASRDYWGHSYFVIPQGQPFARTPPEAIGAAAKYFPPLQDGTLPTGSKLYVEAFFHKGQRYTRSWLDRAGTITSLTPVPVAADKDYEYEMYARATALYPQCPSDGYEMLRFGRILNEHASRSAAPPKTWIPVTFEVGKQGYVEISQSAIQKLSDADFPFFMGWQKVDEGNTPFNQDGLCDFDALRRIVDVVEELETPAERLRLEWEQEDKLAAYIQTHPAVREKLRGFICHAPSEWDAGSNDIRYGRLNDPDGFYGKRKATNPDGYANFLRFHTQLQFMEQTPLGGDRKFWFFHPLAFIRHFRRCGWLAKKEIYQLIPAKIIGKPGSHNSQEQCHFESPALVKPFIDKHYIYINSSLNKYLITSPARQACFFGNSTQETIWFSDLLESRGNQPNLHNGWYGRGFLQLTNPNGDLNGGRNNYYKYFKFIGFHPIVPPGPTEMELRNLVGENSYHASQSASAYWIWPEKSAPDSRNPNRPRVDSANKYADNPGIFFDNHRRTVNTKSGIKIWYYNQSFADCAAAVNFPGAVGRNPPNMNGLIDRSTSFSNALVVLCDHIGFRSENLAELYPLPDGYSRREVE